MRCVNLKLKQRLIIAISVTLVLFTLMLVIDLQLNIGYTERYLVPLSNHPRVHYQTRVRIQQTVNNLQNLDSSDVTVDDNIVDNLLNYVQIVSEKQSSNEHVLTKILENIIINDDHFTNGSKTLGEVVKWKSRYAKYSLEIFHRRISQREMYAENDDIIDKLLSDISTKKIVNVSQKPDGTQLKLITKMEDNIVALFKPMRFPREQETLPNHFYFTDYERHNAEIAAFHLDRLLKFRKALPVAGRVVNITSDLFSLADGPLLKTFFISPANNMCFHGKCSYYCDTAHAICGNPDLLEGSFAAFLPAKHDVERKVWRHPWRRSYHKRRKAQWEHNPNYCDEIKEMPPYNESNRLLDLMDMSILDFLIGNMDRHHYETFIVFGNDTFPIHLDHGRGFGKAYRDEVSILAPMIQCCLIKKSTLLTLIKFKNGPVKLSEAMRNSLDKDKLKPVLWEPHLAALDRRLITILNKLDSCITDKISTSIDSVSS